MAVRRQHKRKRGWGLLSRWQRAEESVDLGWQTQTGLVKRGTSVQAAGFAGIDDSDERPEAGIVPEGKCVVGRFGCC